MTRAVASWPADHLDSVPSCPVCGHDGRQLVHEGLTDVTFSTAQGFWNMWLCEKCGSGYLDPRPDEASIGDAYGSYYTHGAAEVRPGGNGLRHRLGNGYRNWRFGTAMQPSTRLGIIASLAVPALRRSIDASYRFLPNPARGSPRRLLDFGCGDGSFLRLAQAAGWACCGVEPDPAARTIASRGGVDVRPSLQDFRQERFDAVTLSHVVEHVHDPVGLLQTLAARMQNGGHLYIDTPNMSATGHRLYGRNWRGLETPRHLVLMTRASLSEALASAGFRRIVYRDCPGALDFTQLQSRRIAAGADPYDTSGDVSGGAPSPSDYAEALRGEHAEFLRLTAVRA